MGKYSKTKRNESGIAAIFVVMTLMTILALITIGFSHLMNREVRQALDRQLSAEAYYAAESGVNDARNYLATGGTSFTGCPTPDADPNFVTDGDISGDSVAKYTCVTINTTPKELDYGPINPGQSIVIKLTGADLASMARLYFGWENSAPYSSAGPQPLGTCSVAASVFCENPQDSALNQDNTGMLRVGIYPVVNSCGDVDDHGNRFARYSSATDPADATLECAARNYFLYPNAGGAASNSVNYTNARKDGSFVPGNCNPSGTKPNTNFSNQATPRYCNSMITNLYPVTGAASARTANSYYLRLTAVYKSINVSIQATDDASPTPNALAIFNSEGIVDVTGRGSDVLRRIQARIPLQNNLSDNYGLQSMESVCKLFRNEVPSPGIYDNPHLDSAANAYNSDNSGFNCSYPTGSNVINPGGLPPINIEPPPTASLSASPNPISPGSTTVLTWSSTDADTCVGSNFDTGNASSGSVPVGPLSSDTTYSMTCFGPSGSTPASTTVRMIPPPSCSASFSFSPDSGDGNTIVSWSGSGCESYYFDEGGMNILGTCTASNRCWVGASSAAAIFNAGNFCWSFGAATAAYGTIALDGPKCYTYSPPSSGGPGGGGSVTCDHGGSISNPPGCSGCWDGSTATDFSQCPPIPIRCLPLCGVFEPPRKPEPFAFMSIYRRYLLPW